MTVAAGLCPACRTAALPPGRTSCHACALLRTMERDGQLRSLKAIMTEPPRPGRGADELEET